jgi:PmbA protein
MVQSRTLDMDVEFVGRRASELALGSLGGEKIGKVMCDAVLSPVALSQLLFFTLYPAFSAENVAKGRSMLAGRIGEDFGEFSLLDDGTLKGGLATSPFDDEGNPTLKTIIFEKGVLRSFITDFRFSKILQIKTTGNGFKDEATSYPHTSPSNIIFDFEDKSRSIEEDALVVNSFIGAHTSNPISGDFSLECQNSFFRGKPVKSAMIYGNIYELLKKIQAFGKDVRQVDNTVTPSVRFNDVSVSG